YGAFHTADGIVQISVGSEALWRRFAPLVALADDERFATNADRVRRRPELVELLEAAFGVHPTEYWLPRLEQIGVPAGEVRGLDRVYGWDQTHSQRLLVDVEHASLGQITLPGPPLRLFDLDGTEQILDHLAPPVLGQHTGSVLAELAKLADLAGSDPAGGAPTGTGTGVGTK
ncbi:MAG: CoA transferase, partial [Actinomycetes bacterium]